MRKKFTLLTLAFGFLVQVFQVLAEQDINSSENVAIPEVTMTRFRIALIAISFVVLCLPHVALLTDRIVTIPKEHKPSIYMQIIFGLWFLFVLITSGSDTLRNNRSGLNFAVDYWSLAFGPALFFVLVTLAAKYEKLHFLLQRLYSLCV